MKRISWCRVLDNLDLFFTLCTDSLGFLILSFRHKPSASWPATDCLFNTISCHSSPPLTLDAPATLAFFLCLTLSRLFASKSLSCCFLWGKCLFDVLTGLDPSQYSYLSPKFSESSFLNSQSNLLSCPATNPSIMGGFGVFLFCFAFTLIKNSLLLKF